MDSVRQDATFLILGDFNAHACVNDNDKEFWTGVLGKRVCNLAGEDLLQFCGGGIVSRKAGGLSGIGLWLILLFKLLALMKDVCLKRLVCIGWLLTSLWRDAVADPRGFQGFHRYPMHIIVGMLVRNTLTQCQL